MARDFRLPDVGEGIREAEVIKWMVEEGEQVEEDEGVLEVETDKAIIEIPSPVSGEVTETLYEVGDTAEVGDVVARFETGSIQTPETDGSTLARDRSEAEVERPARDLGGGRVFAAPSTRRLAREREVDIQEVEGTGSAGRVTRADVERAAEQQDDEDLPTEVARRKARKEFERRKWIDDDDEDPEDAAEDEGGSGYETAFQDGDDDGDETGGIIIGDDEEPGDGEGGDTAEAAGESRDGGSEEGEGEESEGSEVTDTTGGSVEASADGDEDVDNGKQSERLEKAEDPGEEGLSPEFTEEVEDVEDDGDGFTPEFTEKVADPDEDDDGLTPEFTEKVADPDEDDDGLTPEFERDATTVDRSGMAPEFGEDEQEGVDVGDGARVGREDDPGAPEGEGEPATAEERGSTDAEDGAGEDLDIERVESEVDEAGPILGEGGSDAGVDDEEPVAESGTDAEVAEGATETSGSHEDPAASSTDGSAEGASRKQPADSEGRDARDGGRGDAGPSTGRTLRSSSGDAEAGARDASDGSEAPGGEAEGSGGDIVSYTGNRRRMGERLSEAVQRPLVTIHDEVDVERLHEVQEEVEDVTYTPFVVKACVAALADHPALNSSFDEEAEEILLHDDFHVGVATSTEKGLRVPVLRDADSKDIAELSRELDGMVERARAGGLGREETEGGTFTVTNVGAVGGEYSTPIVNGDEAAVLALGEVRERPRAVDGEVEPRHVVTLSLTFDQRMVDGAEAARFTNEVRRYLRKPALLLVD